MPSPWPNTTSSSLTASAEPRTPVPCPCCGRPLPVWAIPDANAKGIWVKCKNPACRREVEITL